MQQLIYPEPIVTSREQKTFENYLNIDDKSIMVQDTAVDVASKRTSTMSLQM